MIGMSAEVRAQTAIRALEALEADGPRLVKSALRSLAEETLRNAQAQAPGKIRYALKLEDVVGDNGDTFGYFVGPADKPLYDDKPVARWTNYGTGQKADKRVVDANLDFPGQRAQRYLRKVSKARQTKAAEMALIRTAQRLGFNLTPGAGA